MYSPSFLVADDPLLYLLILFLFCIAVASISTEQILVPHHIVEHTKQLLIMMENPIVSCHCFEFKQFGFEIDMLLHCKCSR